MYKTYIRLTLEVVNTETDGTVSIRTVMADSIMKAIKTMEDVVKGTIDTSKVSKKGLDVRKYSGSSK